MARKPISDTMRKDKKADPQGYGVKYLRYLSEARGTKPAPGDYGLTRERAAQVRATWEKQILKAAGTLLKQGKR